MRLRFSHEPKRPSATPPPNEPPSPPPAPEPYDSESEAAPAASSPAFVALPPFSPARMRRQILFDQALHWVGVLVVVAGLVALLSLTDDDSLLSLVPVLLVIGGWMTLNLISARVSRELPRLSTMIGDDPASAEHRLAEQMRRRPLLRWVRLMLYHHLAMLRHRQQRFAEAAAICHSVLHFRLGPARDARPHLLLLLAESTLECGDLFSAFGALNELHRIRLSLVEAIQRLALQTRYELMAGHDDVVLQGRQQKVQLAELMPAPQCAAMHAMLAFAADRRHDADLARWLWTRVELLATPEQFRRFRAGEFSVAVVDVVKPMPHHADADDHPPRSTGRGKMS